MSTSDPTKLIDDLTAQRGYRANVDRRSSVRHSSQISDDDGINVRGSLEVVMHPRLPSCSFILVSSVNFEVPVDRTGPLTQHGRLIVR